jgi:hypothetical protein
MGGCVSQGSDDSDDEVRLYKQGNLTFYVYGIL